MREALERKKKLEKKEYILTKRSEAHKKTMECLASIHEEFENSTLNSSTLDSFVEPSDVEDGNAMSMSFYLADTANECHQ